MTLVIEWNLHLYDILPSYFTLYTGLFVGIVYMYASATFWALFLYANFFFSDTIHLLYRETEHPVGVVVDKEENKERKIEERNKYIKINNNIYRDLPKSGVCVNWHNHLSLYPFQALQLFYSLFFLTMGDLTSKKKQEGKHINNKEIHIFS
ncbi:hypothetical protein ACJX0J_013874, partial [Zea mays]